MIPSPSADELEVPRLMLPERDYVTLAVRRLAT
jgi:hypothetical protein